MSKAKTMHKDSYLYKVMDYTVQYTTYFFVLQVCKFLFYWTKIPAAPHST